MPVDISSKDIHDLLSIAGIPGFTGQYTALGGGEGNNTYVLDCGEAGLVLRVAKYADVKNLTNEARALRLLDIDRVPKLVYFDDSMLLNGKSWILESYLHGEQAEELNTSQLENLGELLAKVHSIRLEGAMGLNFWGEFLKTNRHFGDEQVFLNHPHGMLKMLIGRAREYFQTQDLYAIRPSMIHGDLSLENMLVTDETVSLIDWEFARFTDPMADFSTMFYEDMEYNKGKWRIHISPRDKAALFAGYTKAGGIVDEGRLEAWHNFDKLGGAVYLYWKLHRSGHSIPPAQDIQYREDLDKLMTSLERNL